MQGSRLRVSGGNFVTARPIGVVDGIDYHHTGEVRRVDRKGIGRLLDERSIVLLSALGYSPTGEIFNLACEDVATRAAIDLQADKLLLFSAERGLLDEAGKLVRELRPQQVPAHLARLGSCYQAELLEVPVDEDGMDLDALVAGVAAAGRPPKVIYTVPTFQNPSGVTMSLQRRRRLLDLAREWGSVVLDDDPYGMLGFGEHDVPTLHELADGDPRVFSVRTFSKIIAPGLRVGWIVPGRYYDRVMHMKYAAGGFNVPGTQMAVAAFIRDGHYHRHVRRMRQIYQQNMETYTCWVRQYFPAGICVTRPQGSFLLWVELPEKVDMVCVSKQLCRLKIQAAAGSLFSASGKYRNCLRINVALPPTDKNRDALKKMGEAIVIAMEA